MDDLDFQWFDIILKHIFGCVREMPRNTEAWHENKMPAKVKTDIFK